jgi:hypothetical protein
MELITSIKINASKEKVWKVLTDFEKYSNWNPFIKFISGDPIVGKKIRVEFEEMTFKPKVLVFDENKEFKWIGRLGLPFVFDGTHRFHVIEKSKETVEFVHSEKFGGALVPFFRRKLLSQTKIGFELMNQALKKEAEQM